MADQRSLLIKYLAGGVVNTLLGYAVIFLATYSGASPFLANASGYLFGLTLSFVINKYLVFSSKGSAFDEGYRFLIAFFLAFGANMVALHMLLNYFNANVYVAQLLASATYTVSMWFLSLLIFKPKSKA